MKKTVVSWSGGKDSAFAGFKARSSGFDASHILNSVSKKYQRVSFHGIRRELIELQAEALGVKLVQIEVNKDNYEEEFKKALKRLRRQGMRNAVFGDIELEEHKKWAERVSRGSGMKAHLPLWQKPPSRIINEFVRLGFVAVVTSANSKILGKRWVGRVIDKRFISDLRKKKDVHLLGENGEYHTVVIDGPIFKKKIELEIAGKVKRDGFWFLDISKFFLKNK